MWGDLGESHLDPRGFLCVSREPGDEAEEYREGMEAGGWPIEMLDPDAAAKRWLFLEPGTFRYAYFSPDGGALHCRKIATGLADWLRRHGANVYNDSKVVEIDADSRPRRTGSRRDAAGRPRGGHRRRLGAEAVSRTRAAN